MYSSLVIHKRILDYFTEFSIMINNRSNGQGSTMVILKHSTLWINWKASSSLSVHLINSWTSQSATASSSDDSRRAQFCITWVITLDALMKPCKAYELVRCKKLDVNDLADINFWDQIQLKMVVIFGHITILEIDNLRIHKSMAGRTHHQLLSNSSGR